MSLENWVKFTPAHPLADAEDDRAWIRPNRQRVVRLGLFAEGMGGPGLYGVTKAALNALTIRLAEELPSSVKVNAMCPGWVRTRMGGKGATRSPDEAADTAVWLATRYRTTGGFFRDRKPIDW